MTQKETIKMGAIFAAYLLMIAFGLAFIGDWVKSDRAIGAIVLRTTSARDCVLGAIGAPPKRQPYVDWPCINKVADDWLAGTPNADSTGAMAVILRSVRDGTAKSPIRKPGEEEP